MRHAQKVVQRHAALLLMAAAVPAGAQTLSDEIALGDRAYAALDAELALRHYERAASLDSTSYEAAWKTARSAADLEVHLRGQNDRQAATLEQAERLARRAVRLQPTDPEGRFALARALGLKARSVGVRQRVRYANEIKDQAMECVRLAPRHSGCLHVLGAWNAEVMRLSGVERFFARRVLGGRTISSASWAEAVRYLEAAVAADPGRIAHRSELAEVYLSVGRTTDARAQYEAVLRISVRDFGDDALKDGARRALQRLN